MTRNITERLGAIVLYTLNEADCKTIVSRRINAGQATLSGNVPRDGDTYPAIIVADFGPGPGRLAELINWYAGREDREGQIREDGIAITRATLRDQVDREEAEASVNLHVLLDGYDTYWATSRTQYDSTKHGRWVQVVNGVDHGMPAGVDYKPGPTDTDIEFRGDPRGHWTPRPQDRLRPEAAGAIPGIAYPGGSL